MAHLCTTAPGEPRERLQTHAAHHHSIGVADSCVQRVRSPTIDPPDPRGCGSQQGTPSRTETTAAVQQARAPRGNCATARRAHVLFQNLQQRQGEPPIATIALMTCESTEALIEAPKNFLPQRPYEYEMSQSGVTLSSNYLTRGRIDPAATTTRGCRFPFTPAGSC